MPGGRAGGGGHSSGGGRIGGGGGRIGGSRPSGGFRPSSGGYSGGFGSGGSGGSFWQGMLFGSMMSNQNRPGSSQGTPHQTGYNTQQGPFHQQPTFHQTPQQQQYQQAKESYYKQKKSSGMGCLMALLIVLLFFMIFAFMGTSSSGGIPKSTVDRTKLDSKYVTKTEYYNDTAGVVRSSTALEKGLRAFYDKTGVQPYVYFTPDIDGDLNPSDAALKAYRENLYSELFSDGGHLLVVSYGYDSSSSGYQDLGYTYCYGVDAKTVFDSEAQEIFDNYVQHYASDLVNYEIGLDEFYANVFADTGDRIMQVTPNYSMILAIAIAVVLILFLLFRWWQKVKEQKNKEAAHAEAILNADINDLANDPTLSDLEEKYDSYPSSSTSTSAAEKAVEDKPSHSPFGKVDTYESAREQELKSPTLQDLEDKYK